MTLAESDGNMIRELATVFARHPGEDEVYLHLQLGGREVLVQVGPRYQAQAGPALVEAVDAAVGRSVTQLEIVRPKARANGTGNGEGRYRG